MAAKVDGFDLLARKAVASFWKFRAKARATQHKSGRVDQGERAAVTAGKNMDGFVAIIKRIVMENGLKDARIITGGRLPTLPGFFRPTKTWDLLVIHHDELVAAIEFKSQVGPSFGNNFNNRAEEAIGTAHDFSVAFREGAFGSQPRPWTGWLMLIEDAPASRANLGGTQAQFPVFPEFKNKSYIQRYDILARKMMMEQMYAHAAIIAASKENAATGEYSDISELTSVKTFVASLAGHIAGVAARR